MDFIDDKKNEINFDDLLLDDVLIICNNDNKKMFLDYMNSSNKLNHINFKTIKELIHSYYFYYDEKTIFYLMQKYGYKYEVAKLYLDNLYYVEDKHYDSSKLNKLVEIKKELDLNNLLIYDDLFNDYIKNKTIIIFNYDLNKFEIDLINKLKDITSVKIIDRKYNNYSHIVYECNSIEDEVSFVAYRICELINSGININDIKLTNVTDEYYPFIKKIFGFYNIPISLKTDSIYGTKIVQDFLSSFKSDIEDTIKDISIYKSNSIYNKIIDICNKYRWCDDYEKIKELIIYDLKHTSISPQKYTNSIEIIDYKNYFINNEYVFLMNFNLGSLPLVYKDEDYINDDIKPIILDNTVEKNKREKDIVKKRIDNIKNLIITYKLRSSSAIYYPSILIDEYKKEQAIINNEISYSIINDKLKLASKLDNLIKYGIKTEDLNLLYSNYDIDYAIYNNSYHKIKKENLNKYLNNKLNLSYTKLENYNECAFKYYLSYILNLNIYEDNFAAILGTVFHDVLEKGLKENINIDIEIKKCLEEKYPNKVLNKKEIFFLNKAKDNMAFVIDCIKNQMKNCKLDKILTEQDIYINEESNLKVTFIGKIDKILYKEDNEKTVLALIDYKTGNTDIELGYLPYGLHLQLPIYLYLSSNMNLKNIKYAGIYLQKVMPGIDKIDKTGRIRKEDKLKLEGYSTKNEEVLETFDLSYKDSEVIKGLKVKTDGDFYNTSKVLSEKEFTTLIDLTHEQIKKCITNIEEANFDINPKQEENDKEISTCKYCKYKDICFRKPQDVIKIKKDKDLSYLGGDSSAIMD